MNTIDHVESGRDEKIIDTQTEDINALHDEHAQAVLPESLRHLSESERNAIEKKMVRKIDYTIL
jgi:hypothetical protein